ncbi:MAG TPA: hypothetical protein VIF10_10385 [Methylobacter sp.]|jgi:hypothetical protein
MNQIVMETCQWHEFNPVCRAEHRSFCRGSAEGQEASGNRVAFSLVTFFCFASAIAPALLYLLHPCKSWIPAQICLEQICIDPKGSGQDSPE